MLPEARRRAILAQLQRDGSGTITELSGRFHVSAMTIRRDLKLLEARGAVALTHGGAVTNPLVTAHAIDYSGDPAISAIARYAARHFVNDGDSIFLDASPAACALLPYLRQATGLTIASNSPATIQALRELLPDCAIYGTGGRLSRGAGAYVGSLAERFFETMFARTAFISADAFSLAHGLTHGQIAEGSVKCAMREAAERCVVLLESSKLGKTALAQVLPITAIRTMVSDAAIAPETRQALVEAGIDLHIAPGLERSAQANASS